MIHPPPSSYSTPSAPSPKSLRNWKKTPFSSLRQFPPWTSISASHSAHPPKCRNSGVSGTSCPPAKWPCSVAALLWMRGEVIVSYAVMGGKPRLAKDSCPTKELLRGYTFPQRERDR